MTDRNGAAVLIGARVRFTTDQQWVEGWVRDLTRRRDTIFARVDNGDEESDDHTNGATLATWVPCEEIEVCGEHRREEKEE